MSRVNQRLSDRDRAVVRALAGHRFLTSRHVERLLFFDHASPLSGARTARRVLRRLEQERLLERLERRVGGLYGGSTDSVWMLTGSGHRLIGLLDGHGAVSRARRPGERFLQHYLAIADVHLRLIEADRAGAIELVQVDLEPAAWRHYQTSDGGTATLKPDLHAITAVGGADGSPSPYEDHWFIEVDRATESLPTLVRQCQAYETYRASGQAQAEHGVFPLVLWIVPTAARAAALTRTIARTPSLDADLYRITEPAGVLDVIRGVDP